MTEYLHVCPKCGYTIDDKTYKSAIVDYECPRCYFTNFSDFYPVPKTEKDARNSK